jgi:hypothetical protein
MTVAHRGDLAIWESTVTSTSAIYERESHSVWEIGEVLTVHRGGTVATVREYPGGKGVKLPGSTRQVLIMDKSKVDVPEVIKAWNNDRFHVTFHDLDSVRNYLRPFRRA